MVRIIKNGNTSLRISRLNLSTAQSNEKSLNIYFNGFLLFKQFHKRQKYLKKSALNYRQCKKYFDVLLSKIF